MGRGRRPIPQELPRKLLLIREAFDLTQEQMIDRLGYKRTPLYPSHISEYERGVRDPPLEVVLCYARLVGVSMDVLADDELDLPERLPAGKPPKGVMPPRASRQRKV